MPGPWHIGPSGPVGQIDGEGVLRPVLIDQATFEECCCPTWYACVCTWEWPWTFDPPWQTIAVGDCEAEVDAEEPSGAPDSSAVWHGLTGDKMVCVCEEFAGEQPAGVPGEWWDVSWVATPCEGNDTIAHYTGYATRIESVHVDLQACLAGCES